jgi:hypothetical protein
MRTSARLAFAIILPLLILVVPATATPTNTITVCVSGCDYPAIQPAIEAATSGDTILIAAGTYTEQLTLKSDLTLLAQAGPTQTLVTASASPIISGSNLVSVTLDGLGITGSEASTDLIGLDLIDSSVVISNVIVSDLHGANGTPIYTDGLSAIGLRLAPRMRRGQVFTLELVRSTARHVHIGFEVGVTEFVHVGLRKRGLASPRPATDNQ